MPKIKIIKELDKDTELITYTTSLSIKFVNDYLYDDHLSYDFIANYLIGKLHTEINNISGFEFVERQKIPTWMLQDEATSYLATQLQAYIQKYGPLEDE